MLYSISMNIPYNSGNTIPILVCMSGGTSRFMICDNIDTVSLPGVVAILHQKCRHRD